VTPEFSEFTYGFALTNELLSWIPISAVPIFPSLIEEGRDGGGYDVNLDAPGIPIYLQFKRADCMIRSTARECSHPHANLSPPFYRFKITEARRSPQHQMLLSLDNGENIVQYVAPRFHTHAEINAAWRRGGIASQSIFVAPSQIGTLDDNPHYVAYDSTQAYVFSEPKSVQFLAAAELIAEISNRLDKSKQPLEKALPIRRRELRSAIEEGARADSYEAIGFTQRALAARRVPVASYDPEIPLDQRTAKTLSGPKAILREMADDALKFLSSQLVVVQSNSG